MKKALLMAAVLACFTPAAMAANYVWFEATPGVNASVVDQGQGKLLDLATLAPGAASWTISMRLNQGEEFTSWAEDLAGDTGELVAGAPALGDWAPVSSGLAGVAANAGGWLTTGSYGINATGGVPAATYTLFTFTLTWTPSGGGDVDYVDNWVGSAGFGNEVYPSYVPYIYFGANTPAMYAGAGYNAGHVIKLTSIPEPATLALLGLGALALIRRR